MSETEMKQLPKWLRDCLMEKTEVFNRTRRLAESAWQERETAVARLLAARAREVSARVDFEETLGGCKEWLEKNGAGGDFSI